MPSQMEINELMEQASVALQRMAYLHCEALSLQALAQAREAQDWWAYARILMPLQESRRQRRMIAMEGTLLIAPEMDEAQLLAAMGTPAAGAIVLTPPWSTEKVNALAIKLHDQQAYAEVFFARPGESLWVFESTGTLHATCEMPAPPGDWLNRPILNEQLKSLPTDTQQRDPAGWLLAASEKLGDSALAKLDKGQSLAGQVAHLEACLSVVTDHEIIHQTLFETVRALARESADAGRG